MVENLDVDSTQNKCSQVVYQCPADTAIRKILYGNRTVHVFLQLFSVLCEI